MPSKLLVRNLKGNSYYHVVNSGVAGGRVFLDKEDYEMFLYYMYIYTAPLTEIIKKYPNLPSRLRLKNMAGEIFLVAYVLMPDHFHILLKQKSASSMPRFMKQIVNGYLTFFGKKYKKSSKIFTGRYKSTHIESEYLLGQMVRYVHLNPTVNNLTQNLSEYPWSSYLDRSLTRGIVNRFENESEWEKFHLDNNSYESNLEKIKKLTID